MVGGQKSVVGERWSEKTKGAEESAPSFKLYFKNSKRGREIVPRFQIYCGNAFSSLGRKEVFRGLDKNFAPFKVPRLRSGFRQRTQTPANRLNLTRIFHLRWKWCKSQKPQPKAKTKSKKIGQECPIHTSTAETRSR